MGESYLLLHDGLLKSRTNHGLAPLLLASAPNGSSVGCLHDALLLALLDALLERAIEASLRAQRSGIGAADGRRIGPLTKTGVVGRDWVIGDAAYRGGGKGAGDGA